LEQTVDLAYLKAVERERQLLANAVEKLP
jgi:hypothetical protein